MACFSDCGQPPLVRLRPVLCLAGRVPDVASFSALRAVRVAEPPSQAELGLLARPPAQTRPALRLRCRLSGPIGHLSGLPGQGAGSERERLLAALSVAAVLAEWAAVVSLAAPGVECRGRWSQLDRAERAQGSRPMVGCGGQTSGPLFCHPRRCLGAGLCPDGPRVHAMGVVQFRAACRAVLPPAALCRLFFCRSRDRRRGCRSQPAGGRRPVAAALGVVACCGAGLPFSLDGLDRADHERPGADRHRHCRRFQLRAGMRQRLSVSNRRKPAFCRQALASSRQPLGQCLQPLSRALRLRGLAAIRAAWRRAVCGHQGRDRVRRDADPELDHDRCGAAHSVRGAAHRRHAACDRSQRIWACGLPPAFLHGCGNLFRCRARSFQRLPRGLVDDGKAFIHITRDVRV